MNKKVLGTLATLLIVALLLVKPLFFPPINMYRVPNAPVILNHAQELNFKSLNEKYKEVHENIMVGDHFIHYQVSYVVRYYAPIKVKSFSNFIKPEYKYFGLPSKDHYFYLRDKESLVESKSFDLEFKVVNEGFKITTHRVKFEVNMELSKLEQGMKVAMDYQFTGPDGKEQKGNFEKLPNPEKKSYYHEIPLGKFKTVEFELYLSVGESYVKIIPRVGYSKVKYE